MSSFLFWYSQHMNFQVLKYWNNEQKSPGTEWTLLAGKNRNQRNEGQISKDSDKCLKQITIFCYCLLGVHLSPLPSFSLHLFLLYCSTHMMLTDCAEDRDVTHFCSSPCAWRLPAPLERVLMHFKAFLSFAYQPSSSNSKQDLHYFQMWSD